jgi:hypothetical protein
MGNVDSRSAFDYGNMQLQTNQQFYYPNDVVTGTIYMRITKPVPGATHLQLEFKGYEKGEFTDIEYRRHGSGENAHTERVEVLRESNRDILHMKQPCYHFPQAAQGQPLLPGDYQVPFQFQLPQALPASIYFHNLSHQKKPEARIKYKLKVTLCTKSPHDKEMKYKQILIIRERPEGMAAMINQVSEQKVSTWCCID